MVRYCTNSTLENPGLGCAINLIPKPEYYHDEEDDDDEDENHENGLYEQQRAIQSVLRNTSANIRPLGEQFGGTLRNDYSRNLRAGFDVIGKVRRGAIIKARQTKPRARSRKDVDKNGQEVWPQEVEEAYEQGTFKDLAEYSTSLRT